jgi:hypothetical protein
MTYIALCQKQYNINLLRFPTVIILGVKHLKASKTMTSSEPTVLSTVHIELINTKLIVDLLRDSKFSFLVPALSSSIAIAPISKNLAVHELIEITNCLNGNYTFICAIKNNTVISSKRLSLLKNNEQNS